MHAFVVVGLRFKGSLVNCCKHCELQLSSALVGLYDEEDDGCNDNNDDVDNTDGDGSNDGDCEADDGDDIDDFDDNC